MRCDTFDGGPVRRHPCKGQEHVSTHLISTGFGFSGELHARGNESVCNLRRTVDVLNSEAGCDLLILLSLVGKLLHESFGVVHVDEDTSCLHTQGDALNLLLEIQQPCEPSHLQPVHEDRVEPRRVNDIQTTIEKVGVIEREPFGSPALVLRQLELRAEDASETTLCVGGKGINQGRRQGLETVPHRVIFTRRSRIEQMGHELGVYRLCLKVPHRAQEKARTAQYESVERCVMEHPLAALGDDLLEEAPGLGNHGVATLIDRENVGGRLVTDLHRTNLEATGIDVGACRLRVECQNLPFGAHKPLHELVKVVGGLDHLDFDTIASNSVGKRLHRYLIPC